MHVSSPKSAKERMSNAELKRKAKEYQDELAHRSKPTKEEVDIEQRLVDIGKELQAAHRERDEALAATAKRIAEVFGCTDEGARRFVVTLPALAEACFCVAFEHAKAKIESLSNERTTLQNRHIELQRARGELAND